ncbi:MAG: FkbM family methyltransferase [Terriglobia bacterium]
MSALKPCLQRVLKRAGLHQRLKASCVYDAYWRMTDRRCIDGRSQQVDFYHSLLKGFRRGGLIFDVGANVGDKTDIFLRLGARIVAVEPDEVNQEVLKEKFLRYRLAPKPVAIVGKAVSDKSTIETMWIDGPGSALNTLSNKWVKTLQGDKQRFEYTRCTLDFVQQKEIETTTLDQLILEHGLPFFVKIDVEGHEPNVLRGLRRPVPYLSFEVNLPEFRPEGLECIELLRRLAADGTYNYATNCQHGLFLGKWVDARDISRVLDECRERSVEVFWKTPDATEGKRE